LDSSTRAAIYCRVSTEEQAREGFSIGAQKDTLLSFARIKGFDAVKIYSDEGISGKSVERPMFQNMLRDAREGLFNVILVWKINRFSRRNMDLLNTVNYLRECGVNLISYSEQFDASTPSGKLMLSMLGSVGEFERDTIVENIKAGMSQRARQGLFNGGRVLGYDTLGGKLLINQREAEIIKNIFQLYLSGSGYSSIQSILNNKMLKTKNGRDFDINSIKRILQNPLYAGLVAYNRTSKNSGKVLKCLNHILVSGCHDPIISKEDFDYVQSIIGSKNQSYIKSNDYILSGVLKCPKCKGKMTGHTGSHKKCGVHYRYYVCLNYKNHGRSSCSPNSINADIIESQIVDYLCSIIKRPEIIDDVYKAIIKLYKPVAGDLHNELGMLQKELSRKRKVQTRYFNILGNDTVDSSLVMEKLKSVDCEIKAIERSIEAFKKNMFEDNTICFDNINFPTPNFKNIFLKLDSSTKKTLISSLVKEIQLISQKQIQSIILNFSLLP